ncbi:phosphatase inhibitor-domain-containing protein [Daedaleopsis nitida]|nr:phosphatase inhibitor-domain-containing protein [Daedaleopsis nitida]
MSTRQARRPGASAPSDGSRTIVVEDSQPREEDQAGGEPSTIGSLRLRGRGNRRQRVVWREDVVDNEGAGKKKSKICCIYHKPRQFDESSSSDSSDDASDSGSDDGRARRRCNNDHDHDHDHNHGEHADGTVSRDSQGGGNVHELESDSDDANAYERMPRKKPKKGKNIAPSECES